MYVYEVAGTGCGIMLVFVGMVAVKVVSTLCATLGGSVGAVACACV